MEHHVVGYFKYRTFSALHTVLNKAAGTLLFTFSVLYILLVMSAACGMVCGIAFVSAVEELILTIRSKDLDRSWKSLWAEHKNSIVDAGIKVAERDAGSEDNPKNA